jgi:hypothetical protein
MNGVAVMHPKTWPGTLVATFLCAGLLVALSGCGGEADFTPEREVIPPEGKVIQKGGEVLPTAVPGVFEGSLCDLPLAPTPRPDDPGIEQPDGRCCGGGGNDRLSASEVDAWPR